MEKTDLLNLLQKETEEDKNVLHVNFLRDILMNQK